MFKTKTRLFVLLFSCLFLRAGFLFSQDYLDRFLHYDWRQSVSTHETARVLAKEEFGLCFGINNFFANWSTVVRGHDLLLYDIKVRYGLFKNVEVALKYSYPNTALAQIKTSLVKGRFSAAASFGVSHYKLTTQEFKTDYIIDLYPGIILAYQVFKNVSIYAAPKFVYSLFIADRWADYEDPPRKPWSIERCTHWGYCYGIALGGKTRLTLEDTWHWVNYAGVKFRIHMLGIGVTRIL